jgi:hypothetical protein
MTRTAYVAAAFASLLGFLVGPLAVAAASATAPGNGSAYTAVAPYRIDDTRIGSGFPNAGNTLATGKTVTVQVGGTGGPGGIPISVSAAVLEVTVTNTTAAGFLTAYPAGSAQPTVSNLNWVAGQTVTNLVTVPLSASGQVTFSNYQGAADVVVDGVGYYTPTTSVIGSGLYNGINPTRVLGSASAGAPIGTSSIQDVPVTGNVTGVPANASAVVVQLTSSGATAPTYLTAWPAGSARPTVTNLSSAAGQTVSSRAIVGVGDNGSISIYNDNGSTNVDVDVDGYYTSGAGETGSLYFPINPTRLVDTRNGLGGTPMAAGATESFDLSNTEVPQDVTAVAANFTVVPSSGPGYITVFPATESSSPIASDVNWPSNSGPVANYTQADPPFGADTNVYNYTSGGPIDLVVDAFGYFLEETTQVTVTPGTPGLSASPSTLPADGSSTSVISGTVLDGYGSPEPGDIVKFVAVGTVPGVCSTATLPVGAQDGIATNYSGQFSFTYTASTTPGFCTIVGTEEDTGVSGYVTVDQTSL